MATKKRPLSFIDDESSMASPTKKCKLENYNDEYDDEYDDDEDSYSSDDGWMISDVLKQCGLVKKLQTPQEIIVLIEDFGYGEIIECIYCDKQDHMDSHDFYDQKDIKNQWIFCSNFHYFEEYDLTCKQCFDKYFCQLCQNYLSEDNYKCNDCGNVVCNRCDQDTNAHLNEHMALNIGLTQYHIDSICMDFQDGYYHY